MFTKSGIFRGERMDLKKEIPDLSGQVFVVTGASTGIGYGIVAHLLEHNPAKIITLSSREEPARESIKSLKKYGDTTKVTWRRCNLKNLKEVDVLAKSLRDEEDRIDALILNAGVGVGVFNLSDDGIDSHFQINALSQLHLALILLPKLQQTSVRSNQPSRLIMMSSEMHRFSPRKTKFASLEELNTNVGSTFLYSRSKLAQILLVSELAKRLDSGQIGVFKAADGPRHVLINATHPGGVRTPQQDQLVPAYGWLGWLVMRLVRFILVDPIQVGCVSGLFASTLNKDFIKNGGLHGEYIVPDKQTSTPSAKGRDQEMAKRLWDLSISLLKEKIGSLDYEFDVST